MRWHQYPIRLSSLDESSEDRTVIEHTAAFESELRRHLKQLGPMVRAAAALQVVIDELVFVNDDEGELSGWLNRLYDWGDFYRFIVRGTTP